MADHKKPKISNIYKRKTIKQTFYLGRQGPFSGKCAYCEVYLENFQHGDMEHYRPKAAVTDEYDNPILIDDGKGGAKPHPGYHWLAYDWKNLLPACIACNQPNGDKHGKRNRFPVVATHACEPGEEEHEEPLLIHPAIEDPNEHLSISVHSGLLEPKTSKGQKTIEILGLNSRDRLPAERKKAITTTIAQILKIAEPDTGPDVRASLRKDIERVKKGQSDYAMAGRAAISELRSNVESIILDD